MYCTHLPYQENSAHLFAYIAHLPYAIFLDSCQPYQTQGRYDIMVANPENVIFPQRNLFSLVQKKLSDLKKNIDNMFQSDLPFTIGAIGYVGYDISKQLEKLPTIAMGDIALPKAMIGIYHWSIVVDHREKKTYLISLYDQHHLKTKSILNLLNQKTKTLSPFCLTQKFSSNLSKNEYTTRFEKIKNHIIAGDCYQINFAQRFTAQFEGDPFYAYQILRKKHPAPYSAFIRLKNAAILSLSPERFLKVKNNLVETKPIKGTAPRFQNQKQDQQSAQQLLQSEKDRAENVMIVDLLRNDLSRSCIPGSVRVPTLCALESFNNVHHLVSTVTGKLKSTENAVSLFKNCFPGGSVTGAPKIRAMEIIETQEPHQRSVYCGSIFYADFQGNFDSNIVIRTLICDRNHIHGYAGGGIVYDSNCNDEYQETWEKIGKIMGVLENI